MSLLLVEVRQVLSLAGALSELKIHVFPRDYKELELENMNIHLVEATLAASEWNVRYCITKGPAIPSKYGCPGSLEQGGKILRRIRSRI